MESRVDGYELDRVSKQHGKNLMLLNKSAGWDLGKEDWMTMMRAGLLVGHIHKETEALVSVAGLFPYGKNEAFIGGVIVDSDHKRLGLGTELMEKLLEANPNKDGFIGLIATEEGKALYQSCGFSTVSMVHTGLMETGNTKAKDHGLHGFRVKDLVPGGKLEGELYGAQRFTLLKRRISQADHVATLVDENDMIKAFAMAVPFGDLTMLGCITAPNLADALTLVDHLCAQIEGPIRMDIPDEEPEFLAEMKNRGLVITSQSDVMSYEGRVLPDRKGRYFAIHAQAFN